MGDKMEDMKKEGSFNDISDLKKDLIKILSSELHTKGVQELDAKECGEVADMIKDLAEAEKCCMEACYYSSVVKSMEEAKEKEKEFGYFNERMGYMPGRPGRSNRSDYSYDSDSRSMNDNSGSTNRSNRDTDYNSEKAGREYGEYKRAKRNYTETNSPHDKEEMNEHAMKHMSQAIDTFKEMMRDADPTMRKRMKADLTALINEMPS